MSNLELVSVKHQFQQGNKTNIIIDNLNLSFQSNFSYAIIGISGSGKSTLLSLLAGLQKPTNGEIYFENQNIQKIDNSFYLNKKIGLVFQQPLLLNELTVLENVMLKGLISGVSYGHAKTQALELLNNLQLADKANEKPKNLSGGEQQRISIARALFSKPVFLLADEPTAHLDEQNRDNVLNLLLKIKKTYSIGLIIATHDKEVSNICDKVYCISKGKLNQINNSYNN